MQDSQSRFQIRRATQADAGIVAYHRSRMFEDMGVISGEAVQELIELSREYFARAIPYDEYAGWLLSERSAPETIIAGAGMLLRTVPPFAIQHGPNAGKLAAGKQGLIIDVYAEPAWRRNGLARMLMREAMQFAEDTGIESLILHASKDGRPLYEQLGFVATNEMRLA